MRGKLAAERMADTPVQTVAVDGGASGCRLALLDADGCSLETVRTELPASLSLGSDVAWKSIQLGLETLAERCKQRVDWLPDRLLLGLAGAMREDRCQALRSLIPGDIDVQIATDGVAHLYGATGGKPGICLSIGTGSVVHWLDHERQTHMAGGWGFPIGDEGSGAWLGARVLNGCVWRWDHDKLESLPASSVFHRVMQAMERYAGQHQVIDDNTGTDVRRQRHVDDDLDNDDVVVASGQRTIDRLPRADIVSLLQDWTTTRSPTQLATLARVVVTAADAGDDHANQALQAGATECQRLLDCAPDDLPVFLAGGLASSYQARLPHATRERICTAKADVFQGLSLLFQDGS